MTELLVARRRWWKELLIILGFYLVYGQVRNQFGSDGFFAAKTSTAAENARRVIDFEKRLGLFFEEDLQNWFLDWGWFLWFWNVFYGSLHFVMTIGVGLYLYQRFPLRFIRYRTGLAITTALGLVGFAAFPLMPPRLLSSPPPYGGAMTDFAFVDTLSVHGGLWSFDSGTLQAISNQWAAMPSLHLAWAAWCAIAVVPVLKSNSARIAMWAYPVATSFGIVITANHYWIDGLAGLVVLGAGMWCAQRILDWQLIAVNNTTTGGGI
ncbi:MAG TPA: phosphatase PAP2 family protein [Acidimicrobiales bacterium]|nr:phosphatase PAP2 family protein [Acidimicrobiales bacterium]